MKNILKCAGIITSTLFFSACQIALASEEVSLDVQKIREIAEQETWKHLVFLHRDRPEVNSPDFYLASSENKNPYQELLATLQEFNVNPHSKCKFPARYYWLSKQLNIDYLQKGLQDCQDIPKHFEDFSVLLVSSYLKNPVSSFGHILITAKTSEQHRLLADAYNFGAEIPQNANALIYVTRGLFGYYDASFKKWDYFRNEAQYSTIENRDIWEYPLDLTQYEKELLTYHLHEISQFKFDYYFFKQNCAYRTGELLEFIEGIGVTKRLLPWYSPEYVIQQISNSNQEGKRKIIKAEIFRPSNQTKMLNQFNTLAHNIQNRVNRTIASLDVNHLNELDKSQLNEALYFLLLYAEVKQKQYPEESKYQQFRNEIVKIRLSLPEQYSVADPIIELPNSPSKANKPTKMTFYLGSQSGIDFNIYQRDPLNEYTDLNMKFNALSFKYRYFKEQNFFEANLLHASRYSDITNNLYGEQKWSWDLKIGAKTDDFNTDHIQAFVQGGIGGAYIKQKDFLIYQFLGAKIHNQKNIMDLTNTIGSIYKNSFFSTQLEFQNIYRENQHFYDIDFTIQKNISNQKDIRFSFYKQKHLSTVASIALSSYW